MKNPAGILIDAENVSRVYGTEKVLDGVSLQICPGEASTIIGPSGSGKTTLLGLLALLLEPSAGRICVAGRNARELNDSERSRLRNNFCGFVFQTAQLVGSLTVFDNVMLPALLAGNARAKRKEAGELLERLGLSARSGFLPHQLSLGQKRRVALARALLLRPAVILADEPTNDLDPERAAQVADFLLALPAEGYALVLVTHDPNLARRTGRQFLLCKGKLTPHNTA